MVTRKSDDPLHKVLMIGVGIFENDDIATSQRAVWQKLLIPGPRSSENELIYQQMVADQQGPLHRRGRDLKGLHDKAGSEEGKNHRYQERFHVLGKRCSF